MSLRFWIFTYPVTAICIVVLLEIANIWLGEQMANAATYLREINADWFWLNMEFDLSFLNSFGVEDPYVYYLQILAISYVTPVLAGVGAIACWSAFFAYNEPRLAAKFTVWLKYVAIFLVGIAVTYWLFFSETADLSQLRSREIMALPLRAFWYPLIFWEVFGLWWIGLSIQGVLQITFFNLVKKAGKTA
jgi:hypothetical protein